MVDNVQDDSHPDKPRKPTHVIGVGASAGGLEALQILFRRIPANLDAAFVVVQHLSPDFPSLMDELLSRSSNLKIEKARDGVELEANRIYLNQPGQLLRVVENSLVMTPAPPGHRLLLPIDELFKSLAHSHENRAAGVVLSGSGSDGSRGIMALREVGALVLVQNPDEAQFDGMPNNAIDTGIVDQVLPLRELAETLISYITHSVVKRHDRDFRLYLSERPQALEQVLSKISKQTGLDFRAYKESTIARRIQHRMGITNMRELEDYGDYIAENPDEIDMVRRDLLIGVTQFFRDADVWEMLKAETILPLIQQVKEGDTIRVWCAGCSSGEEAYTLGILFLEAMRKLDVNHSVKIFASDVDQSAISIGAAGVYPANISAEVPPELLDRYFNPVQGSSYQVSPELRSLVVFACHNLIEDPPFSNIHLITCRNTMIYFQAPAQQKVLAYFHFALNLNGHLLLGSAESTGTFATYFETVEPKKRLYKKVRDLRIPVRGITDPRSKATYRPNSLPRFIASRPTGQSLTSAPTMFGLDGLIKAYLPPTLVMNRSLRVVYNYGDTTEFTRKISHGEVTQDLSQIVREEIVSDVLSVSHRVVRENRVIHLAGIPFDEDQTLTLKGLPVNSDGEAWVTVSFILSPKEQSHDSQPENVAAVDVSDERVRSLNESLYECQQLYRGALEELNSTSEELQSSNEELMAANEELQSTNEELQSVNEELFTVNSEYQQKISELTEINMDLENLLKATSTAVLFLDEDLLIRRFTRAMERYVNILDFDIGRHYRDLKFTFDFDSFSEMVDQVNRLREERVGHYEDNGRLLEISATPYFSGHRVRGVMVSIREMHSSESINNTSTDS